MKRRWKLWLPIGAWIVLACAFGVVGGVAVGLGVASAGLGVVAIIRTRTVESIDSLDQFDRFSMPEDESLRPIAMRLIENRDRLSTLVLELDATRDAWDLLPASVIALDYAHRIVWSNAAAKESFNIDRKAHYGELFSLRVRVPDLIAAMQSGFAQKIEVASPAQPHRTLEVTGVKTGHTGWLLIAVDVTELRRVEQMRRDFVGNVAHELKTPLTVIAGFNETLSTIENLSSSERDEILFHMRTQTRSMQRLIEDLLSLSRLETNDEPAIRTPFFAFACIERAVVSARLVQPEGCTITIKVSSSLQILGNESDIEGALINLLVNALRHTPATGLICVEHISNNEKAQFAIQVSDTGVGIAKSHIPRLTERFYRVDRGRSRQNGGTGLGLAIVKHVMIQHGGELQIQSLEGNGSRFSMVFPSARSVCG